MSDQPKELYRIIDNYCYYSSQPRTRLITFVVIRETPCGYWIKEKSNSLAITSQMKYDKKWVSKTTHFALPTIKDAAYSYMRRKKRQLKLIQAQERRTASLLTLAIEIMDKESADANP